jgi:acetone carboxylase gamma subunit
VLPKWVINSQSIDVKVVKCICTYRDLKNNRIYKIEGGAFQTVTTTYSILLSNNKLKEIQPYAFSDINVPKWVINSQSIDVKVVKCICTYAGHSTFMKIKRLTPHIVEGIRRDISNSSIATMYSSLFVS